MGAAEATLGADLSSAHVWRGITLNPGPVVQPQLTVTGLSLAKLPVTVRVFANYDVGNDSTIARRPNLSEVDLEARLDLTGGFSFSYSELTYPGQAEAEPSSAAAGESSTPTETPLAGQPFQRTFESTRELSLGWRIMGPVDASAVLHYDVREIRDYFLEATVGRGFPLSDKSRLTVEALVGYAGRQFAKIYGGTRGGYHHYDVNVHVDYKPTEHLALVATVTYTGTFQAPAPKEAVRFYGGLGAAVRY